jgi:hypothetical protein
MTSFYYKQTTLSEEGKITTGIVVQHSDIKDHQHSFIFAFHVRHVFILKIEVRRFAPGVQKSRETNFKTTPHDNICIPG